MTPYGSFVIEGKLVTKKNSHTIIMVNGRRIVAPDKRYKAWEKEAVKQIKDQCECWLPLSHPTPVHVKMTFYMQDKRRRDLSNLYQGVEDAMQKAGIIDDDRQIVSHDGSRKLLDRARPRVEVDVFVLWDDESTI